MSPAGSGQPLDLDSLSRPSPPAPASLTIFPRRRGGGSPVPTVGAPVAITLDLLKSYADLTIIAAASRIQVSVSPKKAAPVKYSVIS